MDELYQIIEQKIKSFPAIRERISGSKRYIMIFVTRSKGKWKNGEVSSAVKI